MSHFTKVSAQIKDMEALEKALSTMNLHLSHNEMCRFYFGEQERDHVIKLSGPYDVAIEANSNGTYNIEADFYAGYVEREIGVNGSILMRQYEIEKMRIEAKKLNCKVYGSGDKFKIVDPNNPSGGRLEAVVSPEGTIFFKAVGSKGKSCMKFRSLEKAMGEITQTKFTSEYYQDETEQIRMREMEY